MALFVMAANAAGIAGAQILQAHDAPLYRTGFTVVLSLACTAVVFAVISNLQYVWLNRKLVEKDITERVGNETGFVEDKVAWRFSS